MDKEKLITAKKLIEERLDRVKNTTIKDYNFVALQLFWDKPINEVLYELFEAGFLRETRIETEKDEKWIIEKSFKGMIKRIDEAIKTA
jgi:hypothetical protein